MLFFLLGRPVWQTNGGDVYVRNKYIALPYLTQYENFADLSVGMSDQTAFLVSAKEQLKLIQLPASRVVGNLIYVLAYPDIRQSGQPNPRDEIIDLIKRSSPDSGINTKRFNKRETPKSFETRDDIWPLAQRLTTLLLTPSL